MLLVVKERNKRCRGLCQNSNLLLGAVRGKKRQSTGDWDNHETRLCQ